MRSLKSKILFLITFLFIAFQGVLLSQNFKRGYKLLEKQDYEKAHEIFTKVLEDEPENVASQFGMSLIYSNESFTRKDYIIAWEYADFTSINKGKLSEEELEVLTEYYINTEDRRSSRSVKKKIDISIDLILDKLIRHIRESNDIELVKTVLEQFPEFVYYDNTVHIRNYLEYRIVEKKNTIEGYNQFLTNFSDAAQVPLAIEKRNNLIFENIKNKNTLAAYNEFIHKYPESKFASEAIKLRNKIAFSNAKQTNTVESIESFINSYPDALEVLDAKILQKKLIYERAKKIRSLDAYDDFIRQYPEGVQYVDIFNLKATDLGSKLLQRNKYPTQSFQWARVFDNDNKFDEAADVIVDKTSEEIILACNTYEDTISMMNAWIICLKNNGDMAWNKQIGENLNDRVENLKVTENNLYFTGLTRGVNDTILGEPWIFTLKKNGDKVWNRTYLIPSIESFDLINQNEVVFGSYHGDSVKNFYLTKLTSELKRLWKREYSNHGVTSAVSVVNDQLIVGGGNWLFKLNSDGYLMWEQYLNEQDSITVCDANNEYISIAGKRDSLSLFLSLHNQEGSPVWEKYFVFEEGIAIESVKIDEVGNTYFAGTSGSDGVLIKLDNNGNVLDNLMFGTENRISFKSISVSGSNSVYIIANEKVIESGKQDVILLKYTF